MAKTKGSETDSKVNSRKKVFVEEYLIDLNATKVAIRADDSKKQHIGLERTTSKKV